MSGKVRFGRPRRPTSTRSHQSDTSSLLARRLEVPTDYELPEWISIPIVKHAGWRFVVLLGRILVGLKSGLVLLPRYFADQILALRCASQKLFQPWLYSRVPTLRLHNRRYSSGSAARRNRCAWTLPTTMAAKATARKAGRSTLTSRRSSPSRFS